MKTHRYTVALVIAVLLSVLFVGGIQFTSAQNGTSVEGVISSNTVWTQANSPYTFTGDVTINKGVVLTIDPGVIVGIKSDKTLTVDGTLHAYGGKGEDNIEFEVSALNGGQELYGTINFTDSSTDSIIQNARIGNYLIYVTGSSPLISQNDFRGAITISGGSPTISNNTLDSGGTFALGNTITVSGGSPLIKNNTFSRYMPTPAAMSVTGPSNAVIEDNFIYGDYMQAAIVVSSGNPIIERNLITPNVPQSGQTTTIGISVYGNSSPVIENNTIADNSIGLNIYDQNGSPTPLINGNNFEQNSQYNIYLGQQGTFGTTAPDVIVSNNWWGTTDTAIIEQTIFDHKNSNKLGTVTFNPILLSENSNAFPNINSSVISSPLPTSTPITSQNPTPKASSSTIAPEENTTSIPQGWLYAIIVTLSLVIVALSVVLISVKRNSVKIN